MTRAELGRNAVHAGLSLAAAAVAYWLDPVAAAIVLAAATGAALSVELARRVSTGAARAFDRLSGLLKRGEVTRLTGATHLSVGFTVTAVILPGAPTLAGILFAGVADPVAAVVGRRFGRVRYPGGKSVVGSLAFLVAALVLGLAVGLGTGAAVLVAGVLTVVEAFTLPIDDNLYLPLAGAAIVALVA